MILIHKDETEYLRKIGLDHYILAKTCHNKKYVEENRAVINALKQYSDGRLVEGYRAEE